MKTEAAGDRTVVRAGAARPLRRRPLWVGFLAVGLWAAWIGLSFAQERGGEYERRAQEVVANLVRLNGLLGWAPNAPETWPETSPLMEELKVERPAQGVRWRREETPARLAALILANQGLQRVADLSGLTALERLELYGNQLRGLNLEGDAALTALAVNKNQLLSLNLAGCPALAQLSASGNQLTRLDLAGNPKLREAALSGNQLTGLDLGRNPELAAFEASNNRLTALDVSANPALTRLAVSYNRLSKLDVSANPRLAELTARDNELAALDLSRNPLLTELAVSRNQLSTLDLAANPKLTELIVDQNRLTRLDLSQCHDLERLDAQQNPLTEIRLGDNELSKLASLNLDGARLPLSQLAPLVGQASRRVRFGAQENALFEERALGVGEPLDLTAEASVDGSPTVFTALTDKKRRVRPDDYRVEEGRVSFLKPGHYHILMTNDRVVSRETSAGRTRTFKVKVQTGLLRVGND